MPDIGETYNEEDEVAQDNEYEYQHAPVYHSNSEGDEESSDGSKYANQDQDS